MEIQKVSYLIIALTLLSGLAIYYLPEAIGETENIQWKSAAFTTFTSYAACCKNNPNYDPKADKSECEDYSACKYSGNFAAIDHQTFDWVKSHNIIAFYDNSDPSGKSFDKKYGGKQIKLRKNGKEFTALIADTCGNKDCNNCCSKNSKNGFLIDVEYWTVMNNFGNIKVADGLIEYVIV